MRLTRPYQSRNMIVHNITFGLLNSQRKDERIVVKVNCNYYHYNIYYNDEAYLVGLETKAIWVGRNLRTSHIVIEPYGAYSVEMEKTEIEIKGGRRV